MRGVGWFLLILGFSLGIIFGLYYAWEISPIDPREAAPSDLQEQFQEEVRTLIAVAYANTGDLNRALRRLELLSDPSNARSLSVLAQQHLADGRPEEDVRSVAQLAAALATQASYPATPQKSSETATSTASPTRSPTSVPSPTQTPTPNPAYQLRLQDEVCDPDLVDPLIQVVVFDAIGEPVPGVEVFLVWDHGEDHFFTGLKPELGLGYGDFRMTESIPYTLQVTVMGNPITGLETIECLDEDDQPYAGSWLLIFEEP